MSGPAFHPLFLNCPPLSCAPLPVTLENSTTVGAFVIPWRYAPRFRRAYPSILVGYGLHPMGCFGWSCRRHVRSISKIHQDFTRRCPRAGESFVHPWYVPFQSSMVIFRLNPWDATGHLASVWDAEAGELENHYLTTYGSIIRWKGPLGVREFLKNRTSIPSRLGP